MIPEPGHLEFPGDWGGGGSLSEHPFPYAPRQASFLDLLLSLLPGSSPSIGAGLTGRRGFRTLGGGRWGELREG